MQQLCFALLISLLFISLIHCILRMMVKDLLTGVRSLSANSFHPVKGTLNDKVIQKLNHLGRWPVINFGVVIGLGLVVGLLFCSSPVKYLANKYS